MKYTKIMILLMLGIGLSCEKNKEAVIPAKVGIDDSNVMADVENAGEIAFHEFYPSTNGTLTNVVYNGTMQYHQPTFTAETYTAEEDIADYSAFRLNVKAPSSFPSGVAGLRVQDPNESIDVILLAGEDVDAGQQDIQPDTGHGIFQDGHTHRYPDNLYQDSGQQDRKLYITPVDSNDDLVFDIGVTVTYELVNSPTNPTYYTVVADSTFSGTVKNTIVNEYYANMTSDIVSMTNYWDGGTRTTTALRTVVTELDTAMASGDGDYTLTFELMSLSNGATEVTLGYAGSPVGNPLTFVGDKEDLIVSYPNPSSTTQSRNFNAWTDEDDEGGAVVKVTIKEADGFDLGSTLDDTFIILDHDHLDIPSSMTADWDTDECDMTVGWTDNAINETGFRIERKTTGSYSFLANVGVNVTSYEDGTASEGNTYTYKVRAYNAVEFTAFTASAAEEAATCPTIPDAPSNVQLEWEAGCYMTVEWNDNSDNETGFRIESQENGGSWDYVNIESANTTSMLDDSNEGSDYKYRVRSYNAVGNSAWATSGTTHADECE